MEFELNEEQKQIKASVREFAESEIAPHVMEWDEAQHFPIELQPGMAELGLLGVLFPEEYGGAGMGYVEYATIIEELSRVDGSVGISVAAHTSLCSNHIFKYGSEQQKREVFDAASIGKTSWCVGAYRAQCWFRRLRNKIDSRANRGWMDREWVQKFHNPCYSRRYMCGHGGD